MTISDAGTKAMAALDGDIVGAHSELPEQIARWRLALRPRFVIIAEVIAAAIVIAVSPNQWWPAALIALGVLLVVTVSYNGSTLAGWVRRWARYQRHRHSPKARERRARLPEPFSGEIPGISPVGMRWDGQYVVTMIALHGRAFAPTVLVPAGAETVDTVPLHTIADLLTQFAGLELECADVVSDSQRVAPDGAYTSKYDEIIGDRPAVGARRTWLVLRLCPQACLAAMAYRGDAAAAAAAATERIRQAVLRSGCRAVTCTPEQMTAATEALLADCKLDKVSEGWSHVDVNADYVTTYRIAGVDLSTKLLNDVWAVRSERTIATVRLTANPAGDVSAAAVVRFHTTTPFAHPPLLALRPCHGQAFDSLLASLPLGNRALRMAMSRRRITSDNDLQIPVGPSGLMFGMTVTGFPFLMPITDPLRSTRAAFDASLSVVIPLILRASAAGNIVLVHTDRPEVWAPLCDSDGRVSVAGRGNPARREPTVIVIDGAGQEITGGQRGQTLVHLTDTPVLADTDLVLSQTGPDAVELSTPTLDRVPLTVMRPRNESQFLAHLRVNPATS